MYYYYYGIIVLICYCIVMYWESLLLHLQLFID